MKKFVMTLILVSIHYLLIAQLPFTQTDWSGGPGQSSMVDFSKFDYSSFVNYSTAPGEISLTENTNSSFYGVAEYNGKIMVGSSYGNFIYDPIANSWEHSYSGNFVLYHNTIHNGLLYNLHGNNIYTYDGTKNDYGFGPNGWMQHSNLTSLGVTSTYTIESIDGDLYLGVRKSSYDAFVLKWNSTTNTWDKLGNSFSHGVITIAKYNGDLYAGTHWSGQIFKFNGSSWSAIYSTGLMTVTNFLIHNAKLYASGWSGSYNSGKILSFNGSAWSTIYTGYGINKMKSNGNEIVFTARRSGQSGQMYSYDGSSSTLFHTMPSELHAFDILTLNGDIFYGGMANATFGRTATSNFYKNGSVLEKFNCGYVVSSEITKASTSWGSLQYDVTTPANSGISVTLREKNSSSVWGNLIQFPNNSAITLTENTIQYIAYFWRFQGNNTSPLQDMPSL
jgi:hypothetical protein